jgi:autotransporter-associated beta strand protein
MCIAGSASAAVLGTYTFPDNGVVGDSAAQEGITQPSNATFSAFNRTGVTFSSNTSTAFNSTSWSLSDDTSKYVSFSVTADPGYQLDLTGINFSTQRSNTGPQTGYVEYSTDNFATFTKSPTYAPPTSLAPAPIWDFTDFSTGAGGTVTFRFFGFGGTNTAGTLRFDSVALSGSVSQSVITVPVLFWAVGGTSLGGDGTWGATTPANWSPSDATISGTNWDSTKGAVFKGTPGIVTVAAGGVTASPDSGSSLEFDVSGYTITGDAITLGAAAPSIAVTNANDSATINSVLQSTSGINKTGLGTLVLTGNNTYANGTTVTAGTLQLGNGGMTGSITGDVTNGGTIAFNRSDNVTFSGNIGGGTLVQNGANSNATLILTGNATPTTTNITGGKLQVGDGTTAGSLSGNVTVGTGTSLIFNHSDPILFAGSIAGPGNVTQAGPNTVAFTGALGSSSTPVSVTINAGSTMQIGDGASNTGGSLFGPVTNNGALIYNRFGNLTQSDNITGSGTVEKQGPGTLTVTGSFNHAGGTTITAGTLQVGNGGTSGSLSGDVVNNGALVLNRSNALDFHGAISGVGSVTHAGSGELTLSGTNSYTLGTSVTGGGTLRAVSNSSFGDPTGPLSVTRGTVLAANGLNIANPITIVAAPTSSLLAYWNFGNQTANANSSDPGTFNTTGDTEVFNPANKTLSPASSGLFASSALINLSDLQGTMGGTGGNNWGTFGGSSINEINPAGNGALAVQGTANNGHSVVFQLSTLGYQSLMASYAYRSTSTGANDEDWSYSTDGVNYKPITSVSLTTDSTFHGPQTVDLTSISDVNNQGTLFLKVTFNGATAAGGNTRMDNMQFNASPVSGGLPPAVLGSDISSGSVIYSGNISLNNSLALTAAGTSTVTFSGTISDGGPTSAVTKIGTGTLILSGQNGYSGPTTVHQGTLALGAANALSSSSPISLEAGKFSTGGFDQSLGILTVAGSAILDVGATGAGTVTFADSSSAVWGASGLGLLLRINNWTLGSDHIMFSGTGLTGSPTDGQLSQIHFTGYKGTAQLIANELLPSTTTILTRGDITGEGAVTSADLSGLEQALIDLPGFQASHGFNDADMLDVLDVNQDGSVDNGDVQGEVYLLIHGLLPPGPGPLPTGASAVPEPQTLSLALIGVMAATATSRKRARRVLA